ncbi:hypothetical protein EJB05_32077, partial [Eragrostis curvula]
MTRPGLSSAETRTRRGKKRAGIAATYSETLGSWGTKRARTRPKRRRPTPKCSWAELTYGPAGLIAERALANGVEDYLSFRAVCREWRRSAKAIAVRAQGCLDRRFFPRRWIMLREVSSSSRRRFLNVSTGECVHTELPELDGYRLLNATAEGLLALLDASTYAVRLLNPLTRQLAELPSLYPLLPAETRHEISRYGLAYALELVGLGLEGDATVALCFHMPRILVVAEPGDSSWTLVDSGKRWIYSAMSFEGRFYCADGSAVMALEPTTADEPPRLVMVAKITIPGHCAPGGGRREALPAPPQDIAGAEVPWLLLEEEVQGVSGRPRRAETVAVRGLDGLVVFLGKQRALSVPSGVFPTIRANTVYLGFDLREWSGLEKVSAHCLLNGMTERCTFKVGTMAGHDRAVSVTISHGT